MPPAASAFGAATATARSRPSSAPSRDASTTSAGPPTASASSSPGMARASPSFAHSCGTLVAQLVSLMGTQRGFSAVTLSQPGHFAL
uniref:Uncharacterized protein n=1 Tax=Arundo donax TaxID=35708 RepID=A0A0A9DYD9_ARUDO